MSKVAPFSSPQNAKAQQNPAISDIESRVQSVSYCFIRGGHGSHNRLVAGSNPAGATKF